MLFFMLIRMQKMILWRFVLKSNVAINDHDWTNGIHGMAGAQSNQNQRARPKTKFHFQL